MSSNGGGGKHVSFLFTGRSGKNSINQKIVIPIHKKDNVYMLPQQNDHKRVHIHLNTFILV